MIRRGSAIQTYRCCGFDDPDGVRNVDRRASLLERDPETGIRDLDFDAVELLNGPNFGSYERTRRDWRPGRLQRGRQGGRGLCKRGIEHGLFG